MPAKTPLRLVMTAATSALILAGCSAPVDITAAEDAANPDCAHTMIALPDELAGLKKRRTNAQATAAWGEPAQVVLRCGAPDPGVTADLCVGANGVDWITREGDPNWTLISYGRTPTIEVTFNPDDVSSSSVMTELAKPVSMIEATKSCPSRAQDVDLGKTQQSEND
ncbi:DUF3515 family protein [Micrococcoides hystricis]|uniref:DUF3515 family protein n=1 Tax=Micrococcoides hystricis TaxID=1572761 RepID=A0ABV6PC27_9MICC